MEVSAYQREPHEHRADDFECVFCLEHLLERHLQVNQVRPEAHRHFSTWLSSCLVTIARQRRPSARSLVGQEQTTAAAELGKEEREAPTPVLILVRYSLPQIRENNNASSADHTTAPSTPAVTP
jgi:hypothetical protein